MHLLCKINFKESIKIMTKVEGRYREIRPQKQEMPLQEERLKGVTEKTQPTAQLSEINNLIIICRKITFRDILL